MRYDSKHKPRTRARLLRAAAQAVRTQGPQHVGVAGVMARAGLTHGGFYAHFKSKDALIDAAIDEMFAQGRTRARAEFASRLPADALRAYIRFYLSRAHRDARGAGCAIAALVSDLPRLKPSARKRFAAGVEGLREILAEPLRELGHDDATTQADSLLAELVGALSLARIEPDPARSDAILAHSKRAVLRRFNLELPPS